MAVWLGKDIARHIETPPDIKINQSGVDVGVSEVWMIPKCAVSKINGSERETSVEKIKINLDDDGFYNLEQGIYVVRLANKISIPKNAMGHCYIRSTFNRLGMIKSESAMWDAGYSGYGTQTVFVAVEKMKIHKNEFWFQFTLVDLKGEANEGYEGHWKNEKPE